MSSERANFRQEVETVEQWWKNPRFQRVKRPYTAEQVVSKRGTLPIQYPSDAQGKKLWGLLEKHWKNKTASHTYGAYVNIIDTTRHC
jgi:isocitrate lyase